MTKAIYLEDIKKFIADLESKGASDDTEITFDVKESFFEVSIMDFMNGEKWEKDIDGVSYGVTYFQKLCSPIITLEDFDYELISFGKDEFNVILKGLQL